MDSSPSEAPLHLAKNLVSLRKKQGLTQAQLAKASGIPRSTLNHIESGSGNPSLTTLASISVGLGVSIEELLSRPRAEILVRRKKEHTRVTRSQGAGISVKLLPDSIPGMELDRMELKTGGKIGGIPHLAGTREYTVCLKGSVEVRVLGEITVLGEGDLIAFPGDQPHSYTNIARTPAELISVVLFPRASS